MPEKSGIDAAPRLRSCVNAGQENSAAAETVMMINARITEFSPFKWATPPRPTVAASSALAKDSANLLAKKSTRSKVIRTCGPDPPDLILEKP